MAQTKILTTAAQVAELAEALARETVIAVDLEADALHNYQEKVCLLQVSTPDSTVLIDPLAVTDLAPLRAVLADPAIRKIFHAADYDLRCLKRDFDLEVRGLFDTMISAQLLGEERIGLADLLRKYFEVDLDKRYQRADWSQRPLPAEMVRYAAEDTRHLHRLAALFEQRLGDLGRLSWVEEEFALMEKVRFAENGGPLCLRLKGAGTLSRRQLGVAEALLQWREGEGKRLNRPVYKVIGNKPLLDLAERMPQDASALQGIEGLTPRLLERYAKALLSAVQEGLAVPDEQLPLIPRAPRRAKDPEREERFKLLKSWRQAQAARYALDPGVLINNAALEALAVSRPKTEVQLAKVAGLKNWQRQELGRGLLDVLA